MKRLSAVLFLLLLAPNAASGQDARPPAAAPLVVRSGAAAGPAQLTVFCDIESEACERLVVVLRRVVETHPEQVGVTFRHHAPEEHKLSALAYRSALAASRQGKGWELLDMACANRDRLNDAGLLSMAVQLQLDIQRFTADTAAGDVAQVLEDDAAEARRLEVDRVPAVFVNGTRLSDAGTFDSVDAAVRAAIK
jgi:predicted DsbA family dithiol-disulfide isomerase